MTISEDYKILERNLKVLKGKRIRIEYNGRTLLDMVDPSPEKIMSSLYSGGEQ